MTDSKRPDGDELEEQLTIADSEHDHGADREGDPSTGGSVSEVLPEGLEEPDPPVGIP
jgi:hypothetical protein